MNSSRVLLFVLCLGAGNCFDGNLTAKIRAIWNDMDTNVTDGRLQQYEIEQYFKTQEFNGSGDINYVTFDYVWGTRYDDPVPVTEYLFRQWDATLPTDYLNDLDIILLANEIDTNDASTAGYIDYSREFYIYFEKLYVAGPGYGRF